MDLKQIDQTLNLLRAYGAKHFKYKDDDIELELDLAVQTQQGDHITPNNQVQIPSQSSKAEKSTIESTDDEKVIRSQMIGTFYLQDEKEITKPVIKVGDKISQGDIIGYVEAMKVMNEVTSDTSGEITEILVEHGENIEHNQIIVKLK
ncbi:acetyl-CoA carboxylase biotin carboxyl carrier protein subunit [Staphylococcus hyicus]|uniref:acetyl-CoA carboxylase biotin carboxyl carrier protein n=1 Tax=Staphylococcus hyicus TaxID=1284 RepID=UPI00217DB76D|nr:biotin/lipoyl-containing protein [Staphylococcus hyicus]UWF57866.1 acetyl-CoA carboxylase biotin carboxyl carrier protein subunit [Staphylococcus hyicus]